MSLPRPQTQHTQAIDHKIIWLTKWAWAKLFKTAHSVFISSAVGTLTQAYLKISSVIIT